MVSVRPGELPLVAGSEMAVGQAGVIAQVIGMLWRAVLGEIGRAGADCAACRCGRPAMRFRDCPELETRRL